MESPWTRLSLRGGKGWVRYVGTRGLARASSGLWRGGVVGVARLCARAPEALLRKGAARPQHGAVCEPHEVAQEDARLLARDDGGLRGKSGRRHRGARSGTQERGRDHSPTPPGGATNERSYGERIVVHLVDRIVLATSHHRCVFRTGQPARTKVSRPPARDSPTRGGHPRTPTPTGDGPK